MFVRIDDPQLESTGVQVPGGSLMEALRCIVVHEDHLERWSIDLVREGRQL